MVAKTPDRGKSSIEGEKLDDNYQLESDILGGEGDSDGNNDTNLKKPVDKSAKNKSDETESDDK